MTFWAKLNAKCFGCCGGPHGEHYEGWLARERQRQYTASEAKREALQRENFGLEMRLQQALNILDSYQSFTGPDVMASRVNSVAMNAQIRRAPSTRSHRSDEPDAERAPSFAFTANDYVAQAAVKAQLAKQKQDQEQKQQRVGTPPRAWQPYGSGQDASSAAPMGHPYAEPVRQPPSRAPSPSPGDPSPPAPTTDQQHPVPERSSTLDSLQTSPSEEAAPKPPPLSHPMRSAFAEAAQRPPSPDSERPGPPSSRPGYNHGYAPRTPPVRVVAAGAGGDKPRTGSSPRRARPVPVGRTASEKTLRAKLPPVPDLPSPPAA